MNQQTEPAISQNTKIWIKILRNIKYSMLNAINANAHVKCKKNRGTHSVCWCSEAYVLGFIG